MNCQEFLKLHSEFLDERLPPSEAERCRAHVMSCASCARYDRIVRRGLELLRRLPAPSVSGDFTARLDQRVLRDGREDALVERAGGGATVALMIAALLALAAWGPLLRSNDVPRVDLVMETASRAAEPLVDPGLLPAPDWWEAPDIGRAFGGSMRPARHVELAFPGPYSPLIVMPPIADWRGGGVSRNGAAYLTALE
ncbi:MAG: zf-HC2 domain-containing protein [Longimicrobiales bacterium]